ncbi:hypothetical protein LB505_008467 [Fusarium chuoi]|nr:hypothetical protein LB505_008467 [Fusarium chuoi]
MKLFTLVSLASALHVATAAPSANKHSQKKFDFAKINKIVSLHSIQYVWSSTFHLQPIRKYRKDKLQWKNVANVLDNTV